MHGSMNIKLAADGPELLRYVYISELAGRNRHSVTAPFQVKRLQKFFTVNNKLSFLSSEFINVYEKYIYIYWT